MNKRKAGEMFQGILITKISNGGKMIKGIHSASGKLRTIVYNHKYGGWMIKAKPIRVKK